MVPTPESSLRLASSLGHASAYLPAAMSLRPSEKSASAVVLSLVRGSACRGAAKPTIKNGTKKDRFIDHEVAYLATYNQLPFRLEISYEGPPLRTLGRRFA